MKKLLSYEELAKSTQFQSADSPMFAQVEVLIKDKRDRIAEEIMTSEQVYVKNLNTVITLYMKPLQEAQATKELPVTEEEMSTLFSGIPDLINVNTELLRSLIERLTSWSETQTIGDVLLSLAPFLRLYTHYSLNFEKVTAVLEHFEKDKKLREWIEERMSRPESAGLNFGAYLIMPIQRIPRYRLLLEEFLKNTPDTHGDHASIKAALDKLRAVAADVNKAIVDQENRDRMVKIANKLTDVKEEMIIPSRYFILDAELEKVCRKDVKKRHFFLFNDRLLYGQEATGGKYKITNSFDVAAVKVKSIPDSVTQKEKLKHPYLNAFQIVSPGKSFTVLASSSSEKEKWLSAVNEAFAKLNANSVIKRKNTVDASAPVWVPDSEVKACTICSKKFTFTFRRHHCRQCGKIVCADCWTKKRVLPGQGKSRVCDNCYKKPADWTPDKDQAEQHSPVAGAVGEVEEEEDDISFEVLMTVTALHTYAPTPQAMAKSTKLPFQKGQTLDILQMDDSGWWLGEMGAARGWVPASFLKAPPS